MTEPKTAAGKALREMLRQFLTDYTGMLVTPQDADRVAAALGLTWDKAALRASGEWVLVPKEPTEEMLAEGWRHVNTGLCEDGRERELKELWAGMLAAAPKPEDKA